MFKRFQQNLALFESRPKITSLAALPKDIPKPEAPSSSSSNVSISTNDSLEIDQLTKEVFISVSLKDKDSIEAVVVGQINRSTWLIQALSVVGESEWLLLDKNSIDITTGSPIDLEIHTFIEVIKISLLENRAYRYYKYHVEEYCIKKSADVSIGECLVTVVTVNASALSVVGSNFVMPTLVPNSGFQNDVKPGDFIVGNVHRLKPFFSSKMVNNVVCYVKDLEAERQYAAKMERCKRNEKILSTPRTPDNMFYMTAVRTLNEDEVNLIKTRCRDLEEINIKQAHLYIRDAHIALARLERFIKLKSIEDHTLSLGGFTSIDNSGTSPRFILKVILANTDVKQVINSKSQDTWRVGSSLSIRHPDLKRHFLKHGSASIKKYGATMIIRKIDFGGGKCTIQFHPHHQAYHLFEILIRCKVKLQGIFTIGPSKDYQETIVEVLESHRFADFVSSSPIFDEWRGIQNNEKTVIENLTESFTVNGSRLDLSQTIALRTAIRNPGFTCIEAPPGSGKTFLIAALVKAKHQEIGQKGGSICISATTNNAISNAIDKVHEYFPEIRKTREYSKKMEGEINEKSKEISLRQMALNADKYIELDKHEDVLNAIEMIDDCKQKLKTVSNIEQGLSLLDELQSADLNLQTSFTVAYQPYVTGSTCELIARRGDVVYNRANKIKDERKKKEFLKNAITHLILDEASQLPPHLALALYVMLPNLKQVTLIGDSEQLGPYTTLEEDMFAYKMVETGELDRIGLRTSTTKVYLSNVYRSHPKIVDLLLKPIYGPNLNPGLTAKQRSLICDKGFPCAQDEHETPVLFVNIENGTNDKRGVNRKELIVVLDFINQLKTKGVTGEDVAVICNHRAQREAIVSSLRGKGSIGELNTSVGIYTIDSFQGKEAKVVLVLTTKILRKLTKLHSTFQFVANPNRGCVAVSRGQHAVYLFGDWFNLLRTEFWSKFVPGIIETRAMVNSEWQQITDAEYHKLETTKSLPISRPTIYRDWWQ